MYRDLIGDPERITAGGREWWIQQFHHSDGTLKAVRLYDADGEFVGDYESVDQALQMAQGMILEKRGK